MTQSVPSPVRSSVLDDEWSATVDRRSLEILEQRRNGATDRRRGRVIRRALVASDVVGLAVAFVVVQAIFGHSSAPSNRFDVVGEILLFLATLPAWVVAARLYGLYEGDEERTDHSTVDELVGVFHLITVGTWVLFALTRATGVVELSFLKVVSFWGLAIGFVTLGRALARTWCRRRPSYVQNTVIVGAAAVGQQLARKLSQHPECGLNFVGFVDTEPPESGNGHQRLFLRLLGGLEDIRAVVYLYDVERVVVAYPTASYEDTLELIRSLRDLPVQVDVVPRFFELMSTNVDAYTLGGLPLLGLRPFRFSRSARVLKRATDVLVSSAALVLLSPLYAAAAALIRLDSSGPVLFRQVRMGSGGTFELLKLRTMVVDADAQKAGVAHLNKHLQEGGDPRMFKIPGDPRVTRVGRYLRRYSLDELPQLVNVLKGEMSLVGPRPLILDEDNHVEAWGRRRLDFMPGITGPWQVLGRTSIPFEEMIRLDYLYVTEWSLLTDLKWLLRTIPAVLRTSDAS